ncbi:MAG: hypothetical protein JO132_04230 [Streptosporangiaceae bacterium]|nr:hypothetical protein [Streptosporangiaceae bacterium]
MAERAAGSPAASQRDWLEVRRYLQEHRYDLTARAAAGHPAAARVAGTPLLAAPGWLPPAPVPLQDIRLDWRPPDGAPAAAAGKPEWPEWTEWAEWPTPLLPARADGTRYARYSDAVRDLAPPAVFDNRVTYRLVAAALAGPAPRLQFTRGRYFDGIDTGEAAAHEYAAARLGRLPAGQTLTVRALAGDPCDVSRRPANLAISTLTLRLDRAAGRASFLLHWRDPATVGHAGGLYQVIPVGVFQPSSDGARSESRDFSLWRCMVREFAEELRGHPEDGPAGYDSWPFARTLTGALDRGQVRVWCLGLGADPLSYATDLLTVAVVDAEVFDDVLGGGPPHFAEGRVLAPRKFTAGVIEHVVTREPVQAAAAAVLRLAWRHRACLGLSGNRG